MQIACESKTGIVPKYCIHKKTAQKQLYRSSSIETITLLKLPNYNTMTVKSITNPYLVLNMLQIKFHSECNTLR